MQKLILEASDILEDKFKIKPVRTRLFLHEDINKFLSQTRNPHARSIFLPRNLSAHVPQDRLDLLIHEYLGHGLYCEQTPYGQRMVEDEQKFESMNQDETREALRLHEQLKFVFEAHALWTEDFLLRKLKKEEVLERRIEESLLKKLFKYVTILIYI